MSAPPIAAAVAKGPSLIDHLRMWWHRITDRFRESNLERHAREELTRAGFFDDDADYGPGAIADCVIALCKVMGRQGHSGGSQHYVLEIFQKVATFHRLSPLTTDPTEWMDASEYSGPKGTPVYQSRRQPSCFSNSHKFLTYYDIDEPGRPQHVTRTPAQAKAIVQGQDPDAVKE